jgi:hypothetical protein
MKKTLYDYKDKILDLPLKNKYSKEELLIEDFLIDREGKLEVYYAPHNEYINPKAKIFIVGITPGFQQMSTAMVTARKALEEAHSIEEIQYKCKEVGRFSGVIRKNIISMLDEIELNIFLGINSCKDLFGERDDLLHTVSLIPYSTFINKENYSGHTPKLIKNSFLMKYVYDNFINEYKGLENKKEVLLIPLGRAVEEVLIKLEEEGLIEEGQILTGFPHPSGANVNRIKQLEDNKERMIDFIRNFK